MFMICYVVYKFRMLVAVITMQRKAKQQDDMATFFESLLKIHISSYCKFCPASCTFSIYVPKFMISSLSF
jgi:hypothetical protein